MQEEPYAKGLFMGKVTVIAVLMVLAMGTAFVGGLLVAAKVMEKPPAAAHRIITQKDVAASEKGGSSSIAEGVDAMSKSAGRKEATTDELIAMVDYGVTESREAGKMLFRKKTWKTGKRPKSR